jgi:hypothetical protein
MMTYKIKILKEIEKAPEDKTISLYKIIHLLTNEVYKERQKDK